MNLTSINNKDSIFALDIGTRTVIGTVGIIKDSKFCVLAEELVEHKERAMVDGQIHDISLVAEAVSRVKRGLESKLGIKLTEASIAAAGRFLSTVTVKEGFEINEKDEVNREIVRTLEMSAVKKAEEKIKKDDNTKLYCVGYSVKNYYLNGYVISNLLSHKGERIDVEIIATFLPRTVVESLYAVMEKVKLSVSYMTLEPIAAMEAVIPKNLRLLNIALIDIGAGTSDIAISSKDTVNAFGMVPLAGDEVTEAIAEHFMVDFNTAENIKKNCSEDNEVTYTDVLGFSNKAEYKEVIETIEPVVLNIADCLKGKILELNGDKAPSAIFLVGGGAHTPLLKELLLKELGMPENRIAIRGREAVPDSIESDESLGSTGVTVLGIGLLKSKKCGNDFIDVSLNGSVVSLYNSYRHTVMDLILQGGINPKMLIGKNGKGLKFKINGKNKTIFGELAHNSIITINNKPGSIDSEIKAGDEVFIEYAKNGENARAVVSDFLESIYSVSFYINHDQYFLEPAAFLNGRKINMNENINDGDDINFIYPRNIGDFKKINEKFMDEIFYKDEVLLKDLYEIKEGDELTTSRTIEDETEINNDHHSEALSTEAEVCTSVEKEDKKANEIRVLINNEKVTLKGKETFVFVDIFNFYDFDRTKARGNLILEINDKEAKFYDVLKDGDCISIYWK